MKNKGFTFVELAIALLILGLLLIGLITPLSIRVEQKDRQATQAQLEEVKQALLGFAITAGRLPCPDTDNDGLEDRTGTNNICVADNGSFFSVGNLPWADLGVAETDSWNQQFSYGVTSDFTDDLAGAHILNPSRPNPCGTATAGVSFELCSGGNIDINDAATSGSSVISDVPAIVFSNGAHGKLSEPLSVQSADEQENTDNDNIFVFRDYNQTAGNEFDDLIIWISPNILKFRMVQAGRLP